MKRTLIVLFILISSISLAQINPIYFKTGALTTENSVDGPEYVYEVYLQTYFTGSIEPFIWWSGITDQNQTNEVAAGICFSTKSLLNYYDSGYFNIGVSTKESNSARVFLMSSTRTGDYRDQVIFTFAHGFKPYWRIEMIYRMLGCVDIGFYHNTDIGTSGIIGFGGKYWNIQYSPIFTKEKDLQSLITLNIFLY